MRPDRQAILSRYEFPIDRFQSDAIEALDADRHVVVAAPTGSGKTVVAEYAVACALRDGQRSFYTAPIKALSNQKYRDLLAIHGDDAVGLLTGDNAINGDAPIVVMTTEVLRNMIYGGRDLSDLGVVVLDEVHFLQDAYRGPVWEEVMIHLPQHVRLVCLSATVSNSQELSDWVETVRGPTTAVLEMQRPVELENLYLVADRTNDRVSLLPTVVDGQPSRKALRLDASAIRRGGGRRRDQRDNHSGTRKLAPPTRIETVDVLSQQDLLPAIYFIFSRNQCEEAARTCAAAGFQFTNDAQRARIREIVDRRLEGLVSADLDVLGYDSFLAQLVSGIAPHHAGMIPPFKEVVELCFNEGLISVVFATETLAVGVNMPARSVVIEKLTKFTGDHHEALSPAQYTQLTGRAGRRGIDEHGSAIVLWSPFVRFDQAAELAMSRTFHLRSVFRPTYNMAANLVRTYDSATARQLLALSFAQFQADRDVVKIERRLQRQRTKLAALRAEASSGFGDIDAYRRDTASVTVPNPVTGEHFRTAVQALRPGALIYVDNEKFRGPVAIAATANRSGGMKITTITPSGRLLKLTASDFEAPPTQIGSVMLPGTYSPNRQDYRMEVGRRIKRVKLPGVSGGKGGRSKRGNRSGQPGAGRHAVERDPDLRARLKTAAQADRVEREIDELEQRVQQRNSTLVRDFDAVLEVLATRGYVDIDAWLLTDSGERLARVFHESDLLVSEAIRLELLDGLDDASLAGMVSTFVYEHRSPDDPPAPWFPSSAMKERWAAVARLSDELAVLERRAGIAVHRPPDPGFFAIAYAWVAGEGFAEVVAEEDLTGGDFVRNIKQLIDLLSQVATISPNPETRAGARRAREAAFRGVIADSAAVEPE